MAKLYSKNKNMFPEDFFQNQEEEKNNSRKDHPKLLNPSSPNKKQLQLNNLIIHEIKEEPSEDSLNNSNNTNDLKIVIPSSDNSFNYVDDELNPSTKGSSRAQISPQIEETKENAKCFSFSNNQNKSGINNYNFNYMNSNRKNMRNIKQTRKNGFETNDSKGGEKEDKILRRPMTPSVKKSNVAQLNKTQRVIISKKTSSTTIDKDKEKDKDISPTLVTEEPRKKSNSLCSSISLQEKISQQKKQIYPNYNTYKMYNQKGNNNSNCDTNNKNKNRNRSFYRNNSHNKNKEENKNCSNRSSSVNSISKNRKNKNKNNTISNNIQTVHNKVEKEISNIFNSLPENCEKDPEIHNKLELLMKNIKDIRKVIDKKTQTQSSFRPKEKLKKYKTQHPRNCNNFNLKANGDKIGKCISNYGCSDDNSVRRSVWK